MTHPDRVATFNRSRRGALNLFERVDTSYEKSCSPTKSGMGKPMSQRQSHVGSTSSGRRRFAGGLPAICDFSITNVGNAACDLCGFSRDKRRAGPVRYVDPAALTRALPILRRRGIRFMTLQGGEPLVHPDAVRLVSEIATAGVSCALITNGWFLPRDIDSLVAAGLARLIVSIDSADTAEHEGNRGLPGLERRLTEGVRRKAAHRKPHRPPASRFDGRHIAVGR
jgi:radical SAM family protein